MHRNGYKGRKFGRERDQRNALVNGLTLSLIDRGSIVTTLPKAKELRPHVEKLITKAKSNSLHARRQILSSLHSVEITHKLVDEIAPKITRESGYLRITKMPSRRGDNALMAQISFVDDLTASSTQQKPKEVKSGKDATASASPKKKKIALKPKAKSSEAKK